MALAGPPEPAPQDDALQAGDGPGDYPGSHELPAVLPQAPDERPALVLAFPARPSGGPGSEGPVGSGAGRDAELIAAGIRIREEAERDGVLLTRRAFADKVREQGYTIANGRLSWLRSACGFPSPDD
jgi:hypothetical protein